MGHGRCPFPKTLSTKTNQVLSELTDWPKGELCMRWTVVTRREQVTGCPQTGQLGWGGAGARAVADEGQVGNACPA